jgi:hypothetical protein
MKRSSVARDSLGCRWALRRMERPRPRLCRRFVQPFTGTHVCFASPMVQAPAYPPGERVVPLFARGPSPAATAANPKPPPADTRLPPTHVRVPAYGHPPPQQSRCAHPPPRPAERPTTSSKLRATPVTHLPLKAIPHSGLPILPKVSRLPSPDVSIPFDTVSTRLDTFSSKPPRGKPCPTPGGCRLCRTLRPGSLNKPCYGCRSEAPFRS